MDDLYRAIEATQARHIGNGEYHGKCPAHPDKVASLSFREGDGGRLLFHCHAGCTFESIAGALGLSGNRTPPNADELEQRRAKRLAEQEAHYKATAERAQKAWSLATPAPDNHPYLVRKAIQPCGVGVLGCQYPDAPACVRDRGNLLVIPVMTDHVHSVQFIAEDGTKAFIQGSQRPGGYYQIGKQTERTWLCEGFATGASIHEASGERVIVCFNTNGLKRVAASISNPKLNLLVMADDDWQTKGNPGLTAAKWIQEHHGIDYVSPEWGDLPRQPKDTDYNDLQRLRGQHG